MRDERDHQSLVYRRWLQMKCPDWCAVWLTPSERGQTTHKSHEPMFSSIILFSSRFEGEGKARADDYSDWIGSRGNTLPVNRANEFNHVGWTIYIRTVAYSAGGWYTHHGITAKVHTLEEFAPLSLIGRVASGYKRGNQKIKIKSLFYIVVRPCLPAGLVQILVIGLIVSYWARPYIFYIWRIDGIK